MPIIIRLTDDDGSLPLFQGRSSVASSFHASLPRVIDGVMSLALCPQAMSQAPQHFRSSETIPNGDTGCFARQSIYSVISNHSAVSGQSTHRGFRRWMGNTDTCQPGLPSPLSIIIIMIMGT